MQDLNRARGAGTASSSRRESVAFSPPCRLRLEGDGAPEENCEILELSSDGVSIAMVGHRAVHKGQHGRLVIGPPEGDHYELPVDVSWVDPSTSISVLGLTLQTPPHWRFARS